MAQDHTGEVPMSQALKQHASHWLERSHVTTFKGKVG